MYVDTSETISTALVQGDVLSKIQIFGAINPNAVQFQSQSAAPAQYLGWSIQNPPAFADAMVLSHSCEIAPENSVKLTSVILAPIRDLSKVTSLDKIQELIGSNIIDLTNPQPSFLKYFYLQPNERLEFPGGAIVDFSKCFSVRKNAYNELLTRKVLQLSSEMRDAMALKLALYFHRPIHRQV